MFNRRNNTSSNDLTSILKLPLLLSVSLSVAGCASLAVESTFLEAAPEKADYLAYSLPKSVVKMNLSHDKNKKLVVGKATVEMVADPRSRFELAFLKSAFAEDQFNIDIGTNGLLSSAKVVNEDKTPEIVSSLTEFIPSPLTRGRAGTLDARPDPVSIDLVFDPDDPRQVNFAKRSLEQLNLSLNVKTIEGDFYYPGNDPKDKTKDERLSGAAKIAQRCNGSICFRTLRPIIIEISGGNLTSRQVVNIADIRQVSSLDIRRAPCVKKTNNITLENGVLTKADITKPSEVLGCISIPANIVKAAFGFPG